MSDVPSFDLLDEIDSAGLKVAVLRAALELDVFGLVAAGVRDEAGLAAAMGASHRGVHTLVRALLSLELLERDDAGLRCSPTASAYLIPESPTAVVSIYLGWLRRRDHIVEAIRSGLPVADHAGGDGAAEWRSYAAPDLLRWPVLAPEISTAFAERGISPSPGARILDLGCGSGLVGFALAAAVEGLHVTAVDRPEVTDVARELAIEMGVADRAHVVDGDVLAFDIGEASFDAIYLVNVAQYVHDDDLLTLLARCRAGLRPGGLLYVSTVLPDHGTPGHTTNWASAVEMFLNSSVDQRVEADVLALLGAAGFRDVARVSVQGFAAR